MAYYVFATDGSGIAAFDLLESETHTETCSATENNVEDGSPVTDHVVVESSQLSLSLGVTNTPMGTDPDKGRGRVSPVELFTPTFQAPFDGTPGSLFRAAGSANSGPKPQSKWVSTLQFIPSFDRISETEQLLLDIKNSAKLCTVITLSRTYDDMVIEKCELRREKPGMAMFALDLRQIRFVKTASVQAPKPLEPRGTPSANKGQQAASPSTSSSDHKSDLLNVVNQLGKLAGFGPLSGP